jgi:hypothetical protein
MSLVIIALVGLILLVCFNSGWWPAVPHPPRLVGDGSFTIEVTGSAHYLSSFEKICGRRTADCINRKTEAQLTLENGNRFEKQSMRVSIEGHTVGYMPQASTRSLLIAAAGVGLGGSKVFECAAHIRGKWDKTLRKQDSFGVWLDLPSSDTPVSADGMLR